MSDKPPASAHSAAEELRAIAAKVEQFFEAEVQPCIERNAAFVLFGEGRNDPYARVVDQCVGLMPGFAQALRMRAAALSPPGEVGVAAPPPA